MSNNHPDAADQPKRPLEELAARAAALVERITGVITAEEQVLTELQNACRDHNDTLHALQQLVRDLPPTTSAP